MNSSYFQKIEDNFYNIIKNNNNLYNNFNFIIKYDFNILLYSKYGFPLDLLINEIIKKKYKLDFIYKKECTWDKSIIYYENYYFIEIDLMNPSLPKDYTFLTKFILHILKNKNISGLKHLIIIKHINILREYYSVLKILLESYASNAYFICTTYSISSIEAPIISRFTCFRIPLLKNDEIQYIFIKFFNKKLNKYLIENNSRNLIFCIFIANVEEKQPELITKEYCILNFPPLYNFITKFNKKKYNLDDIRTFSYNCFQYNIKIDDIISDILKIIPNLKNKTELISIGAELEHKLISTNRGREPIYIEALLCYILL